MTSISDTNVVNAPGGLVEVAFQQRTTEYITSSTTVSGASNIFSSNATFIADGSPYIVDFFCGRIITYGPYTNIYLVDGSGNSLGMFGLVFPGDNQVPGFYRYRFVPAAGTVVNLNIRGIVNTTGSATYGAGDGGTGTGNQMPMQLRVSKIIQASQLIVQTPNAPLVTSLPSNAIDGQEVRYLANNTNGIIWNFRYRAGSSSAYKWEFIGGQRLGQEGVGGNTWGTWLSTSSLTSVALSGGPSVTIPLAGDYEVIGQANAYNAAGDSLVGFTLATTGGTGWSFLDAMHYGFTSYQGITIAGRKTITGLSANSIVSHYYAVSNASAPGYFYNRNLWITPIRVSA